MFEAKLNISKISVFGYIWRNLEKVANKIFYGNLEEIFYGNFKEIFYGNLEEILYGNLESCLYWEVSQSWWGAQVLEAP